jgi:hypothetical protein
VRVQRRPVHRLIACAARARGSLDDLKAPRRADAVAVGYLARRDLTQLLSAVDDAAHHRLSGEGEIGPHGPDRMAGQVTQGPRQVAFNDMPRGKDRRHPR